MENIIPRNAETEFNGTLQVFSGSVDINDPEFKKIPRYGRPKDRPRTIEGHFAEPPETEEPHQS
jgi:hypothetical protein